MSAPVPFSEAVAVLRRMVERPDRVRAIAAVDDVTCGPLPFFVAWTDQEAVVTLAFALGDLEGLVSVRIGDRFSNEHAWLAERGAYPLDELSASESSLLAAVLRSASIPRRPSANIPARP